MAKGGMWRPPGFSASGHLEECGEPPGPSASVVSRNVVSHLGHQPLGVAPVSRQDSGSRKGRMQLFDMPARVV